MDVRVGLLHKESWVLKNWCYSSLLNFIICPFWWIISRFHFWSSKHLHTVLPSYFHRLMDLCYSWNIQCLYLALYWRWLLRVPWTARRSNWSILKEISPKYSLKGLMQKLKLQYFGYLMRRTDSLEKTLILGKVEGRRRRGWQRMRWLDGISDLMDMSLSRFWELVKDREAWDAVVHGVTKNQMWLNDWTELI